MRNTVEHHNRIRPVSWGAIRSSDAAASNRIRSFSFLRIHRVGVLADMTSILSSDLELAKYIKDIPPVRLMLATELASA
jgi:hypothetical protein